MLSALHLERAWPLVRRCALAYSLGQAVVLGLVALLGLAGGQPAIMSAGEVSAWRSPLPGPAGSAAAIFAALSILFARAALRSRDRAWRRASHVLSLGWAFFWFAGSARAASADPDALFVAALLAAGLGTVCQVAVSATELRGTPATTPAPEAAAGAPPAAVKPQ